MTNDYYITKDKIKEICSYITSESEEFYYIGTYSNIAKDIDVVNKTVEKVNVIHDFPSLYFDFIRPKNDSIIYSSNYKFHMFNYYLLMFLPFVFIFILVILYFIVRYYYKNRKKFQKANLKVVQQFTLIICSSLFISSLILSISYFTRIREVDMASNDLMCLLSTFFFNIKFGENETIGFNTGWIGFENVKNWLDNFEGELIKDFDGIFNDFNGKYREIKVGIEEELDKMLNRSFVKERYYFDGNEGRKYTMNLISDVITPKGNTQNFLLNLKQNLNNQAENLLNDFKKGAKFIISLYALKPNNYSLVDYLLTPLKLENISQLEKELKLKIVLDNRERYMEKLNFLENMVDNYTEKMAEFWFNHYYNVFHNLGGKFSYFANGIYIIGILSLFLMINFDYLLLKIRSRNKERNPSKTLKVILFIISFIVFIIGTGYAFLSALQLFNQHFIYDSLNIVYPALKSEYLNNEFSLFFDENNENSTDFRENAKFFDILINEGGNFSSYFNFNLVNADKIQEIQQMNYVLFLSERLISKYLLYDELYNYYNEIKQKEEEYLNIDDEFVALDREKYDSIKIIDLIKEINNYTLFQEGSFQKSYCSSKEKRIFNDYWIPFGLSNYNKCKEINFCELSSKSEYIQSQNSLYSLNSYIPYSKISVSEPNVNNCAILDPNEFNTFEVVNRYRKHDCYDKDSKIRKEFDTTINRTFENMIFYRKNKKKILNAFLNDLKKLLDLYKNLSNLIVELYKSKDKFFKQANDTLLSFSHQSSASSTSLSHFSFLDIPLPSHFLYFCFTRLDNFSQKYWKSFTFICISSYLCLLGIVSQTLHFFFRDPKIRKFYSIQKSRKFDNLDLDNFEEGKEKIEEKKIINVIVNTKLCDHPQQQDENPRNFQKLRSLKLKTPKNKLIHMVTFDKRTKRRSLYNISDHIFNLANERSLPKSSVNKDKNILLVSRKSNGFFNNGKKNNSQSIKNIEYEDNNINVDDSKLRLGILSKKDENKFQHLNRLREEYCKAPSNHNKNNERYIFEDDEVESKISQFNNKNDITIRKIKNTSNNNSIIKKFYINDINNNDNINNEKENSNYLNIKIKNKKKVKNSKS